MGKLKALLATARQRVPLLDHLVRAAGRYQADTGDRLAAGVTYYFFLSLFPIMLLAVSVLGYVYGDDAQARVQEGLGGILPGGLVDTLGQTLDEAKGPAGVLGLVGLLYAGLGFVDALREAIRTMWHQNVTAGNFLVKKALDVVVLIGLLGTVFASVLVSGLVTGFTDEVLDLLGLERTPVATVLTRLTAYALALLVDTALFLYLFTRLTRAQTPWRRVLRGAVFGAVGFELLKVLGGLYVERTTSRGEATYGTFAVVVGLLLFLFLLSRLILFAAAFAVTDKGDSDVAPSGTADPATAAKAGMPVEYAGTDLNLVEDGAPTPLRRAVQGEPADPDAGDAQAAAARDGRPSPGGAAPVVARQPLPGEQQALLAARAGAVAGGVVLAGVGLYAARTVAHVLRR